MAVPCNNCISAFCGLRSRAGFNSGYRRRHGATGRDGEMSRVQVRAGGVFRIFVVLRIGERVCTTEIMIGQFPGRASSPFWCGGSTQSIERRQPQSSSIKCVGQLFTSIPNPMPR